MLNRYAVSSSILVTTFSMVVFLCGCVPLPTSADLNGGPDYEVTQDPLKPVEIDGIRYQQTDLAILSLWAPGGGAYVETIDGVDISTSRFAPPPVWLKPGRHEILIKWMGVLSRTYDEKPISVELKAGGIYLPYYASSSKPGTVNLGVRDLGPAFPRECFPAALQRHGDMGFNIEKYRSCIDRAGFRDLIPN